MKAPLLKRRLNPFLLASIVLILSLLAGLSVLYQGKLSDLVSDNRNLTEELQDRKDRINSLEADKSNLSSKLETTEEDLDRYITLYNQEKDKRETLNQKVSTLEDERDGLEDKIDSLEATVTEINTTLGDICDLSYENLTSLGQNGCVELGHHEG